MRKTVYILCCLASLCIALMMCYEAIVQFIDEPLCVSAFTKALACIGWGLITKQIVQRKYKWMQALCK